MKDATLQEIFEKVGRHLMTQGARSTNLGKCAYRGEEGRMCAVGVLIPDEAYTSAMEGRGVDPLLRHFPEVAKFFRRRAGSCSQADAFHASEVAAAT